MLELLDAEEEVLISLPGREAGATQALLHRSIDQASRSRRAFARPVHNVRDDGTSLIALDATLLDQAVNGLLYSLAREGCGSYLQEDQAFQRFEHEVLLT